MDRQKENISEISREITTSSTLSTLLEEKLQKAYMLGFCEGQKTPDNRNINQIQKDVHEIIYRWLTDNDMWDSNLMECIDMCFTHD
jgi:hypothetical protein